MSLLTVKKYVFGYLKLDSTLVSDGSADPDGYTQTQILDMINAQYNTIAVNAKCLEDVETITVSTASAIYESDQPTGYIDSFFITPTGVKDAFTRTNYADLGNFHAYNCRFYAPFKDKIYLYDATQAGNETYIHTYYKAPTALTADADTLTYPLSNWERLIALGAVNDLIAYDTSQSANVEKMDFRRLFADKYTRFINYWSNRQTANGGIFTPSRLI